MTNFISNLTIKFFSAAVCIAVIGSAVARAQSDSPGQDETLRWKFSEGDVYTVELGQRSSIDSEVNNRKVTTTQEVNVAMNWKVDFVERNKARMTWTFTRVHSKSSSVKMRTQGGDAESPIPEVVEFDTDSAKPEDRAASKLWNGVKPIIDQPFKVTLNDRGEVTGVAVPKETMDILRKFSGSMRIRQLMTEEGIKEVLGRTSITLPDETVSEGHSWKTDRTFEIPLGKIKQVTNYTYKGPQEIEGQAGHLIEAKSDATIDSFVEDGRPKLQIDSQDSTGELWFDVENGFMTKATVTSSMNTTTPYRDLDVKAKMTSGLTLKISKNN